MAASAALLPLDQSHLHASTVSEDVSSARQRRRRTTKKSGSQSLTKRGLGEGDNGLELDTLESSGSPRNWPRMKGSPHRERQHIEHREKVTTVDITVETTSLLIDAGRQGHSHRRKKARQKPSSSKLEDSIDGVADTPKTKQSQKSSTSRGEDSSNRVSAILQTKLDQHPDTSNGAGLEDSTDGVAAILQAKLDQLELDDGNQDSATITPRSDPGHSSGIVTESEEEHVRMEAAANTGRPLPPPAPASSNGSLADSNATPTSTDILGITLHGTDELQASIFLTHPSVRISIVDASIEGSGSLLKKSAPEKCVTSYYEKDNPSVDYILPVLTQPFECRHHRALKGTLKAEWEETLTFNERLSYFTSNENAVIFFELLDFVTFGGGRVYPRQREQKPWHRIAWGFLRPSGKTCRSRIGKKIRLQLYKYPRKMFGHSTEGTEVYDLWQKHYRSTYPSTLYVTLSGISTALPEEVSVPSQRSWFPLQEEKGSISFEQMMQLQMASKSYLGLGGAPTSTLISASLRFPGQACQIPTSHVSTQYPTPMGCSSLAFSHSGHLLAAGCADQDSLYPIVIFEVPSFKPVMVTEGHRGIIYQVCWSEDDQLLASASADGIVKLWSPEGGSLSPLAIMPHPCYVYCVCFLTGPEWREGSVLATGAYDGYIRIWSMDGDASVQIVAEFHGHHGHVNCLAWLQKASILYAGDSKGILGAWHKKKGVWMLKRKANVVNGQPLISINLHPNHRKLLLHTQKATLAMLDLRISHICCEYAGIQPSGLERCGSLLSPCGGLVFAGTPYGTVHVWNANTGKELYRYSDLPFSCPVGAMAYHPSEHMLALSSFGDCQPLMALSHLIGSHPPVASSPGNGALLTLPVPVPTAAKGEGSGVEDESGSSTSVLQDSQLKDSQRLSDLVKTLDRVTARTKSS